MTNEELSEQINKRFDEQGKAIKSLDRRLKKVHRTVDVIAKLYNAEDVRLFKRVKRVEDYLKLPPLPIGE